VNVVIFILLFLLVSVGVDYMDQIVVSTSFMEIFTPNFLDLIFGSMIVCMNLEEILDALLCCISCGDSAEVCCLEFIARTI
jgi:hypothetical protein